MAHVSEEPGRHPGVRTETLSDHGEGWVAFAGAMILLAGAMNVIDGIAAIDSSSFFVSDQHYVFSDLNTWGWIILGLGVLQIFAAFSVWGGGVYGRWFGMLMAGLNAIGQLLFIPAYPFWSLAIFTIDILVIYGLVVYGGTRPNWT